MILIRQRLLSAHLQNQKAVKEQYKISKLGEITKSFETFNMRDKQTLNSAREITKPTVENPYTNKDTLLSSRNQSTRTDLSLKMYE